MELLFIKQLFGYSLWIGVMEWKASDNLFNTLSTDQYNREAWLFGRLHIVITNARAYA
jgi:hypothetical protein